MRTLAIALLTLCIFCTYSFAGTKTSQLSVSTNQHYLQDTLGNTVYILADTAWSWKAWSPANMDTYLKDRRSKGFNMIMIAHYPTQQDYQGNYPFETTGGKWDPTKRVAGYWDHLRLFVDKCDALGIYVLIQVMWNTVGDGTFSNTGEWSLWTSENNVEFATWLGGQYATDTNVMWSLAGDHSLTDNTTESFIDDFATGIAAGDTGDKLITSHTGDKSLSDADFGANTYFDFYTIQEPSHHESQLNNTYLEIEDDWDGPTACSGCSNPETRPTFNMESAYEEMPIDIQDGNRDWNAHEIRMLAWTSVFAGAFGYGYGHNMVYQARGEQYGKSIHDPEDDWDVAIDKHNGQKQLKILRSLMEQRTPMEDRIPFQALLGSVSGDNYDSMKADANCVAAFPMSSSGTETNEGTDSTWGTITNLTETGGDIPLSTDSMEGNYSRLFAAGDTEYLGQADGLSTDISCTNPCAGVGLSICAWVKLSNLLNPGDWYSVVAKYESDSDDRQYVLGINASEQVDFYVSSDGTTTNRGNVTSSGALSANTWAYICGVYDPSQTDNTQLQTYLNGSLDGQTDWDLDAICDDCTTATFNIGASQSGTSDHISARIDAVLIFDDVLTAQEISDLYNSASGTASYGTGANRDRIQCTKDLNGKWGACYTTAGEPLTLDTTKVGNGTGRTCTSYWLNPRTGRSTVINATLDCGSDASPASVLLTPPSMGIDWVLVVDDNAYNYPDP